MKEAQSLANESEGDYFLQKRKRYNVIKQMGFIKHAFVLAYYYLLLSTKKEITYKDTIREINGLAGDSDTNACIVGAMIGALLGFKALDEAMVKTVLSCDVTGEGPYRPEWLSVGKTAVYNIGKLIDCRAQENINYVHYPKFY